MLHFDYAKLQRKIEERYGTQAAFAKAVGLSEHSVSVKLNNLQGWKQEDMVKCCKVLGIDIRQIHQYFFTLTDAQESVGATMDETEGRTHAIAAPQSRGVKFSELLPLLYVSVGWKESPMVILSFTPPCPEKLSKVVHIADAEVMDISMGDRLTLITIG